MSERAAKVAPGIIDVESITVLRDDPETLLVSIDCRQKYPEAEGIGVSTTGLVVFLGASERTLRVENPQAGLTLVEIAGDFHGGEDDRDGEWRLFVTAGRYEVAIAAVKVPR